MADNDAIILDVLRRLEDKVQRVSEDASDIKIEQARQGSQIDRNTESLDYHIARTNSLQDELVSHIQTDLVKFSNVERRIDKIAQPLSASKLLKVIGAFAGMLAGLSGGIYYILKMLRIVE